MYIMLLAYFMIMSTFVIVVKNKKKCFDIINNFYNIYIYMLFNLIFCLLSFNKIICSIT
eukprot:UN07944